MKRTKITDNFCIDEFIDPVTYGKFGDVSRRYIRKEIVQAAQYLRTMTGLSITINNWASGGSYKESGLRNFETSTGAKYSAHKFGAAVDLKIGDLNSFEMVKLIKEHELDLIDIGICRYENPEFTKGKHRSWLHIDALYTGANRLIMVNP